MTSKITINFGEFTVKFISFSSCRIKITLIYLMFISNITAQKACPVMKTLVLLY